MSGTRTFICPKPWGLYTTEANGLWHICAQTVHCVYLSGCVYVSHTERPTKNTSTHIAGLTLSVMTTTTNGRDDAPRQQQHDSIRGCVCTPVARMAFGIMSTNTSSPRNQPTLHIQRCCHGAPHTRAQVNVHAMCRVSCACV